MADKMQQSILAHLAKATLKMGAKPAALEVDDSDFAKACPILYAFLAANENGAGKARERSSLSIFCEGGRWKVSLNDRDVEASLFVTLDTITDAFDAIERQLAKDDPD